MKRTLYITVLILAVIALQIIIPDIIYGVLNSITGKHYYSHIVSNAISFSSLLFCSFVAYLVGRKLQRKV